jgi:hypothetical protein
MSELSEYDKQAQAFLDKYGLKVTYKLLDCDNAPWDKEHCHNHYRVTITRKGTPGQKLTFQWWDSIQATEKNEQPTAYDSLSSISSDSTEYSDFEEFCGEMGYDTDSIEALHTWKAYNKLSSRINKFFTEEEIESLSEIQ